MQKENKSASLDETKDRKLTEQLESILKYIKQSWKTLTRSNAQITDAAVDPKFPRAAGYPWPVYVPHNEDIKQIEKTLREDYHLTDADFTKIKLRSLPDEPGEIQEHGLLYLPYPYVVPGGRFNEMYGWDSYFIQIGLLRDGEVELAKNMIDNFLYQIKHYGQVLNANRTYYLTRSQPPFLTQMILGVYGKTQDLDWLKSTVPKIEKYYSYWTNGPYLTEKTGLSRYYDQDFRPAPEVVSAEPGYYDRVKEYYRTHEVKDYDLSQYYDRENDQLTDLFYIGDRSMRESGFDPSDRFGPFNIDIIHYNPVCLNSLLCQMEIDTAEILKTLGSENDAKEWENKAKKRKRMINSLMWDEHDGLYYDYNFIADERRCYPFVTTFYPLWAGIAEPEQAKRVVDNIHLFERAGGLLTSTNMSGAQWDAPFGWAPMQMIAIKGLRQYGYIKEANRITAKFLTMIMEDFRNNKNLFERYDVVGYTSQLSERYLFSWDDVPENKKEFIKLLEQYFCIDRLKTAKIEKIDDGRTIRVSTKERHLLLRLNNENLVTEANLEIDNSKTGRFVVKEEKGKLNVYFKNISGYTTNEIGFGWTNAVFIELYAEQGSNGVG